MRKEGWKEEFIDEIEKSYCDLQKGYHNRKFKVVKIHRSLQINGNARNDQDTHKLRIDYQVKEIKTIYWKFWQTYKFKQFIKKLKL